MKIAIDIGHPAHVHFFKHFIWEMEKKGHECLITVIDKDIARALLDNYGLPYTNLGVHSRSMVKKMIQIPWLDYRLYQTVKKFQPDLFMGLASFRAAHVAFFMRKKCILFDDTETGVAERKLYMPFTDYVCTPVCFQRDIGKKQLRYPGYHELAYLHPNRFQPDPAILTEMGLTPDDRFVVMRFVGWEAVHDRGHSGMTMETKRQAVELFSKHARVFITSEKPLPEEFEPYRIAIPPEKIHHVLAYADLLYGESATMASECAALGTPAIHVGYTLAFGNMIELEETYDCVYNFHVARPEHQAKSIEKGLEILTTPDVKRIWARKRERLLQDKIDVTAWMIELAERV